MRERRDTVASCFSSSYIAYRPVSVSNCISMDPRETDVSSVSSEGESIFFEVDNPSTSSFTPIAKRRRSPHRFTPTTTPQKKPK